MSHRTKLDSAPLVLFRREVVETRQTTWAGRKLRSMEEPHRTSWIWASLFDLARSTRAPRRRCGHTSWFSSLSAFIPSVEKPFVHGVHAEGLLDPHTTSHHHQRYVITSGRLIVVPASFHRNLFKSLRLRVFARGSFLCAQGKRRLRAKALSRKDNWDRDKRTARGFGLHALIPSLRLGVFARGPLLRARLFARPPCSRLH